VEVGKGWRASLVVVADGDENHPEKEDLERVVDPVPPRSTSW
jgi:hypothetical protein